MKIQIINAQGADLESIVDKLEEVVTTTIGKLATDKGIAVADARIIDAEFTIGLEIEGLDELQYLTVEHHEGVPEAFKWVVDMGNDKAENNEDASYFDSWSVAKYKGHEQVFEPVESVYVDEDMFLISEETFGNMSKRLYNHMNGFEVARIYQNGALIQEYKLIPKE